MADEKEEILETVDYGDDNIRHLSDVDHIRTRPGMYIGKMGDGSYADDGIYVLLKEAIDNSIDEFRMHEGERIEIEMVEGQQETKDGHRQAISLRDYGRGIPQGKMIEAVSQLNT